MATPKIIADFETSLATPVSVGSTSFTLASATDDDGVALPTGKYYFTVDNASNQKEYFVGTLTGTNVASVSSVARQGAETSGAVRAHRVGASVIMTDFMTYKNYIDETTTAGAPDASITTKGVVEIATLAEFRARTGTGSTGAKLAISPDLADDLPTQNEKLAMAGGGAFGTPSGSNKFITETYLNQTTTQQTFTSNGTWTKQTGLKRIHVQLWGSGGSGSCGWNGSSANSGGGGGGYIERWIEASTLGVTESVTIGVGGAAIVRTTAGNSAGNIGNNSTFGSLLTAFGGGGGSSSTGAGGPGASSLGSAAGILDAGNGGGDGVTGGASINGGAGGGGGTTTGTPGNGGASLWGGAGGAGHKSSGTTASGGVSIYGGNGGASAVTVGANATAVSGSAPGGGGGSAYASSGTVTSGAGGNGKCIVTEYYA